MFNWWKKKTEDRGARLAFEIAFKANDIRRAFEIARQYSVVYSPERIGKAFENVSLSTMSDADKAAHLVCLMDPFWETLNYPVPNEWVTEILRLDPKQRYHVTVRRMDGNVRLNLIEQMLNEGEELPHNIRMALSESVKSIRGERQDDLLARLVAYSLERNEIEVACEAGMLIHDSTRMSKESWRTLIARVADRLSSDKAVALGRVAASSFFSR